MKKRNAAELAVVLALTLVFGWIPARASNGTSLTLEQAFAQPPPAARPWVYWFWNNGNVTKAGITADLEAMKRAGIGGVIIMDVVERFAPPPGTADFMNAEWQELFRFAVAEAHRLAIDVDALVDMVRQPANPERHQISYPQGEEAS